MILKPLPGMTLPPKARCVDVIQGRHGTVGYSWEELTYEVCCGTRAAMSNYTKCFQSVVAVDECCGYDMMLVQPLLQRLNHVLPRAFVVGERSTTPPASASLQLCADFINSPAIREGAVAKLQQCAYMSLLFAHISTFGRAVEPWASAAQQSCSLENLQKKYHRSDVWFEPTYLCSNRFWLQEVRRIFARLSEERLARGFAEHAAKCADAQNPGRVVFNPYAPQACFFHHPAVWEYMRRTQDEVARLRRSSPGMIVDWMGTRSPHSLCSAFGNFGQGQDELTRMLECRFPSRAFTSLMVGEDYFESLTLLKAVRRARDEKRDLLVFDVGGLYGYWSVKAAVAWRSLVGRSGGGCHLILMETEEEGVSMMAEQMERNDVQDVCRTTPLHKAATATSFDEVLREHERVDLLHMDIQSTEEQVISGSRELSRVRHLHLGTHSQEIHQKLRSILVAQGFHIDFDFPWRSYVNTEYGPVPTEDGVLAVSRQP
eukprot:TRINITY_DN54841_c0_g1_i2.p1 TRINITY_DN54841_c0_g1~~TRINITY_DN54841_c0_g1_i2.p1  ORF type:complete len:487 (-),score=81.70 TRINITY_DN54841_c0_g1_i2:444-1904(-)